MAVRIIRTRTGNVLPSKCIALMLAQPLHLSLQNRRFSNNSRLSSKKFQSVWLQVRAGGGIDMFFFEKTNVSLQLSLTGFICGHEVFRTFQRVGSSQLLTKLIRRSFAVILLLFALLLG